MQSNNTLSLATPPGSPHASTPSAPHRILVVGGAYAGIAVVVTLLKLADGRPVKPSFMKLPDFNGAKSMRGISITLLDERDGFFHSVGAPLAHVTPPFKTFWKTYKSIRALRHPNLQFLHGSLQELDCSSRTATYISSSGQECTLQYDYIVCATGYKRNFPIIPFARTKREYVQHATSHIDKITSARDGKVVVIGGGAVGIEFAGEIAVNHTDAKVTLIHSRDELLSAEDLAAEFKLRVLTLLRETGVEVILGKRAKIDEVEGGKSVVTLADGRVLEAGHVIDATGKSVPSTSYLPTEALDKAGHVVTTPRLTLDSSIPNAEQHYAVGDIVQWSGIKRAGGALGMGHMIAHNIFRDLLNSEGTGVKHPPAVYPEVPPLMGLAIGKQCVSWYPNTKEVKYGVEEMKDIFADDLGWKGCLNAVDLTDFSDDDE